MLTSWLKTSKFNRVRFPFKRRRQQNASETSWNYLLGFWGRELERREHKNHCCVSTELTYPSRDGEKIQLGWSKKRKEFNFLCLLLLNTKHVTMQRPNRSVSIFLVFATKYWIFVDVYSCFIDSPLQDIVIHLINCWRADKITFKRSTCSSMSSFIFWRLRQLPQLVEINWVSLANPKHWLCLSS